MIYLYENIVQILISLMQSMNIYHISGNEKKYIVIHIINNFVINKLNNDEDLINFINIFFPHIINVLISVDKKQVQILSQSSSSSKFKKVVNKILNTKNKK